MEETVLPGKAATPAHTVLPYTSRTKKSFAIAVEAAQIAGDAGVGVEHILAGLYGEGKNIGAEILQRCGLTAAQVGEYRAGGER
jgi:ATP-dependent Clp protease ATP-binding subunit ClpA